MQAVGIAAYREGERNRVALYRDGRFGLGVDGTDLFFAVRLLDPERVAESTALFGLAGQDTGNGVCLALSRRYDSDDKRPFIAEERYRRAGIFETERIVHDQKQVLDALRGIRDNIHL